MLDLQAIFGDDDLADVAPRPEADAERWPAGFYPFVVYRDGTSRRLTRDEARDLNALFAVELPQREQKTGSPRCESN
jgi:hypothetical protein